MEVKNKKILITGATGFIGSNAVRKFLQLKADVHVLTRKESNKWRIKDILAGVREHRVNLLDYSALEKVILDIKPDIILHAAIYGGYAFQKDVNKIMQINIIGTANLLNACLKTDFNLFVNTSSSSEYGIKDKPMKESDTLEALDNYGLSKVAATLYCQAVTMMQNRPVTTLRLFSPYGYYEEPTRLISSVIISCLKRKNPKVSSQKPVRDFVFIEDVMDAYAKVVKAADKAAGEIFNIGYGKQYSLEEVVSRIVNLTGNNVKPEWKSLQSRKDEPDVWQANIFKAKDVLGWEPRYNLDQGLDKNIEWFKNNINLYDKM